MDGDLILQAAGDKCFNEHGARLVVVIEQAELEVSGDPIPSHEGAGLVAAEQDEPSLRIPDGHAHAVAVGVGANDQIRSFLLG